MPAASRNPGCVAENTRLTEEKLPGLYMDLTGCDEREARSTCMHVEPADDGAAGGAG